MTYTNLMARMPSVISTCLLLALYLPTTAVSETEPADSVETPPPTTDLSGDEIIERALERAAAQDDAHLELGFEYFLESAVDTLNKEGEITKSETARYHLYPLEGLLYEELVARNGEPLDDQDSRNEQKKKADFIRETRKQTEEGTVPEPDETDVRFDRELMERYDVSLVGTDIMGSYECWVLSFTPKSGQLPDRRQMDKALNRSTGQIWIAKTDYGVARISFEMQRPFRYLWGLIATLRHATGRLDFERIDQNHWSPHQFDLTMDLRVFFKGIRRHVRQTWIDRRSLLPNETLLQP